MLLVAVGLIDGTVYKKFLLHFDVIVDALALGLIIAARGQSSQQHEREEQELPKTGYLLHATLIKAPTNVAEAIGSVD